MTGGEFESVRFRFVNDRGDDGGRNFSSSEGVPAFGQKKMRALADGDFGQCHLVEWGQASANY